MTTQVVENLKRSRPTSFPEVRRSVSCAPDGTFLFSSSEDAALYKVSDIQKWLFCEGFSSVGVASTPAVAKTVVKWVQAKWSELELSNAMVMRVVNFKPGWNIKHYGVKGASGAAEVLICTSNLLAIVSGVHGTLVGHHFEPLRTALQTLVRYGCAVDKLIAICDHLLNDFVARTVTVSMEIVWEGVAECTKQQFLRKHLPPFLPAAGTNGASWYDTLRLEALAAATLKTLPPPPPRANRDDGRRLAGGHGEAGSGRGSTSGMRKILLGHLPDNRWGKYLCPAKVPQVNGKRLCVTHAVLRHSKGGECAKGAKCWNQYSHDRILTTDELSECLTH